MKLFSPESAGALIPKLAPLVEELLAKRRALAIALLESDPALHGGGAAPVRPRIAQPHSRLPEPRFGDRKAEIIRLVQRIEAYGCRVKDLDLGLLDFPGVRAGEPVMLCWKLGEPEVAFWHGVDEGFRDRKPIDDLVGRSW